MGTSEVDLSVEVASLRLENPVMTASGTAGHGTEFSKYMDMGALGAVVVKSLSAQPWAGNPPPRLRPTRSGMLNSVGLQGPGVERWATEELPALKKIGATVVVSIWGRTVEEYSAAARLVAPHADSLAAVEVNLSCPNLDGGKHLFAHDPSVASEVISTVDSVGIPRWAKLSANTDRLVEVADAVSSAGAEAVTLINTLLGMVIDVDRRIPALGAGGGGLSGSAIHPVAVRSVYEVHDALPDLAIVGAGGVDSAETALEMIMAGADAVQVGTASFQNPQAPELVRHGLEEWCIRSGVRSVRELKGSAHG